MRNNFAIELPDLADDENSESLTRRFHYFAGIQGAIRHQKNWEILDECTLGIFSFQKIAMWNDMGENQDQIVEHKLCRAVAGDQLVRLAVPKGLPKASDLDAVIHPTITYHILDSDSSQHEAIEAAKRGASLVLDGPPGTGKSQTIANMIAEFLAMGKTVLFVSEKSAALEVVKRRLEIDSSAPRICTLYFGILIFVGGPNEERLTRPTFRLRCRAGSSCSGTNSVVILSPDPPSCVDLFRKRTKNRYSSIALSPRLRTSSSTQAKCWSVGQRICIADLAATAKLKK